MPDFVSVEHDPFAQDTNVQLTPVDYNPFEGKSKYYLATHGIDTGPKPVEYQPSTEGRKYDFPYTDEGHPGFPISRATARIFGTHNEERYQFFPEKVVRSIYEGMNDPSLDVTKGLGPPSQTALEGAFNAAGVAGGAPIGIKPGVASLGSGLIRPMKNINEVPAFYSAVENAVNLINQPKMTGQQWLGTIANKPGVKPEEMQFTGLQDFLKENADKPVTKQEIQNFVNENKVQVNEVNKGELKFNKDSQYALPQVIRAAKEAGETPGDLELTLANDGDAYRALTKKFPELSTNEDWASIVAKDVFGGDSMPKGTTKYQSYQLPGGENYREKLFTLPEKQLSLENSAKQYYDTFAKKGGWPNWEDLQLAAKQSYYNMVKENNYMNVDKSGTYQSSHWDEPNVLAHVRMNDRTIEGQKSLHIEEIQSDWHQQGREQGYKSGPEPVENYVIEGNGPWQIKNKRTGEIEHDFNRKQDAEGYLKDIQKGLILPWRKNDSGVPDAPFKKTWPDLVIKRMVREAAEKGYDKLSWTPGEAQAARYDLSKQVDSIKWEPSIAAKDNYLVNISPKQGSELRLQVDKSGKVNASFPASQGEQFQGKNLADIVGKEIAKKIIAKDAGHLKGLDLKVGGEGMKGFYDQIVPKIVEKITGQKVKYTHIGIPHKAGVQGQDLNVAYIDIPQKLKDTALQKGFSLFSGAGHMLTPVDHNPFSSNQNEQ